MAKFIPIHKFVFYKDPMAETITALEPFSRRLRVSRSAGSEGKYPSLHSWKYLLM